MRVSILVHGCRGGLILFGQWSNCRGYDVLGFIPFYPIYAPNVPKSKFSAVDSFCRCVYNISMQERLIHRMAWRVDALPARQALW